ncbi:hypothetical protein Leryth_018420 [Lithospermum erythrorhizon]|nr:hypothetical protein Leryth_018420 [Lithospermum erythrorhizon]
MADESNHTSHESRDDDDDEDYEEVDSGERYQCFLFGNVDDSGHLDVDYLDELFKPFQDAKDHIGALVDKLGPSLNLDISVKSLKTPSDAIEQDYDKKAADAVDYEDFDEEYDGPEVQTATEEDLLLPKKDFLAKDVYTNNLGESSLFDDENYDEDDELEKGQEMVESSVDIHGFTSSAVPNQLDEKKLEDSCQSERGSDMIDVHSEHAIDSDHLIDKTEKELDSGTLATDMKDLLDSEHFAADLEDVLCQDEDKSCPSEEPCCSTSSAPLPILCIENGMVILRFSEIFGIHEPLKKKEKRDHGYSVSKEKYKCMDITDVVEEDEEALFKGSSSDISSTRLALEAQDDIYSSVHYEPDDVQFQSSSPFTTGIRDQKKDFCYAAEPMNVDATLDLPADFHSPVCPRYCPLDQQDWEDRIIWDNSPYLSINSAESSEISGPEDMLDDKEGDSEAMPETVHEDLSDKHEKDHVPLLHNWPVHVESFGSRTSPVQFNRYHPQLLRLDSRLDSEDSAHKVDGRDGTSEEILHDDVIGCFSKLGLQNRDISDGSWLDNIIWEPHQPNNKPKLILDLQDKQMLFEILDSKNTKHLQLHAGAMVTTRPVKLKHGDSLEQHGHGGAHGGRFNIANDKFYSNKKSSQQLKSHLKKRSSHGLKVLHSIPALKLETMKAKLSNSTDVYTVNFMFERLKGASMATGSFILLFGMFCKSLKPPVATSHFGCIVVYFIPRLWHFFVPPALVNKDIANFHRPKAVWYPHDIEVTLKEQGKLPLHGQMKILLKSLGGKGTKLHVDAEETVHSIKEKASKKLEPVKIFYSGRELEDHKSLSSQDVRPNSLLHLVRTRIHFLPRAQKLPSENKALRPPGAFKKKSDLSVKDGHVFLMEYSEERPLLIGNVGMGARLCTYYQKSSPGDQTGTLMRNENNGLGSVLPLDPADKSPFLADIKPGCCQSSLETNMYRAPIFRHKVPSTDYLLVRSAKGKLSIRRIDRIDVVGQQEPHLEVMSPGSKSVQMYLVNRLLVYMYREFRSVEKRGGRPFVRADDLTTQFPSLPDQFIRKRLKHFADWQRAPGGQFIWSMKHNFRIPLEEELRRMVTPENVSLPTWYTIPFLSRWGKVCAYESMQAGLYRLKRLGITTLTHPTGLTSAMNQLPYDALLTLAAASHIERELQMTPWNLSNNFVSCTNQGRENIERLEITGVGDPTGRGLGFSYVRTAPKAPASNGMAKKKAFAGKGTTVTGTDADLRRLSMEAAREVLLKFNVADEQIDQLTRWHRIALIRKLSSEQATSAVKSDHTTISKYARGQRMSFLQLQQQTREKCQEIWDRQVQSLGVIEGEENEFDSEVNSDLDSFAGDLENLLAAEEFEEGGEGNESKHDNVDGVKGPKMRRRLLQAQAEEEMEDEAAEAAELCRMLMDDNEANKKLKKKKKKTKASGPKIVSLGMQSNLASETADKVKKTNPNIMYTSQPEGLFAPSKDNITVDNKEEFFSSKKSLIGKVKAKNKYDSEPIVLLQKKIKILGDTLPKIMKEKKSARDSFVCGACGQLGHMRTNKNCPKYREDPEIRTESTDQEKSYVKPISFDHVDQPQQKAPSKKLIQKSTTKLAIVEAQEEEKSTSKAKVLKVKCAAAEWLPDKLGPSTSQNSEKPVTSDADTGSRPLVKVNKIIFSNKMKSEEVQAEAFRPAIVIRPPMEAEQQPQPRKKIIIKRPKDIVNVDENSQEGSTGSEYRKTRKLVELSSFERQLEQESPYFPEVASSRKNREENEWWDEEWKYPNRQRSVRTRKTYEKQGRVLEEQERLNEIRRYEETIRIEREEEERQKARKKNKKKKPVFGDDYLDDVPPRRNDRRTLERERMAKRKLPDLAKYNAQYGSAPKRRRGGEVVLSNILLDILDTLKSRHEVSFLFLKPVLKKEAPDYYDIITDPMDLSTIRDKVTRLIYKSHEEFRHDVCRIVVNAHKYNARRHPHIPPLADQLLELCDYLLDENTSALAEAEAGIEMDL